MTAATDRPDVRPNVLVMLHDNVGYGDLGCYGGGVLRGAPTPRLDALAAEGLRFTNFNVESQCTPTRSAIMTGRLPIRSGTSDISPPGAVYGLAPWEYTLGNLFADAGYATGMFGKWHLGDSAGRFPTDQGFDEWYGFPNSSDETLYAGAIGFDPAHARVPHLWEGSSAGGCRELEPYTLANRPLVDERIAARTADFIERHVEAGAPFFAFVGFSHPHHPVMPHPDFAGRSGNGDYADVMLEIDHRVGEVLDALERSGAADDTIVVWLSDNGPQTVEPWSPAGDTGPFRGELGTVFEGAIRVPAVLRWPGRVAPGSTTNEIVSGLDLYPTLAALAGAGERVPGDRPIDGVDQSPLFLGERETSARDHVLFFLGTEMFAIKWGRFKIHFLEPLPAPGARGQASYPGFIQRTTAPRIYNIEQDPKERYDILLQNLWMFEPIARFGLDYYASVYEHPNVVRGADAPPPVPT